VSGTAVRLDLALDGRLHGDAHEARSLAVADWVGAVPDVLQQLSAELARQFGALEGIAEQLEGLPAFDLDEFGSLKLLVAAPSTRSQPHSKVPAFDLPCGLLPAPLEHPSTRSQHLFVVLPMSDAEPEIRVTPVGAVPAPDVFEAEASLALRSNDSSSSFSTTPLKPTPRFASSARSIADLR